MKNKADSLLPFMRNQTQAQVLAHVLFSEEAQSVAQIAKSIEAPRRTVAHEVSRLEESSVLLSSYQGNSKIVSLNKEHLLYSPLSQMLQLAYGPYEILKNKSEEIKEISSGVEEIYIYGSWARRYQGETGPPPEDLDILIIGDVSLLERHKIVELIKGNLEYIPYEVNSVVVDTETWLNEENYGTFLKSVMNRPLVRLI